MSAQLALFAPARATPRFNPDAALAGFRPNLPGVCCPHYRLEHEWGAPYGACRFCDCNQYREV
ncbi:hypothetical protein [Mycobacterium talmoniae]|uniref:Uncharacterized protein n=1 Tax=Mycobacterium talmoniae TaxID=1858794 RepID=A0A1S1NDF3_9MYCO|nr:hypothetical protein [Mycobacterium talmoniae]OHV03705.1 hypothetical protein BKN37_13610 [Mycobacterium talmoniae]